MKTKNGRIGILGGSFDPIHLGHLAIGESAAACFRLEKVLAMPCALSPFKVGGLKHADDADRAAMVKAAIEGNPLFEYCGIELARGGVSYAVDSVACLHNENPGSQLFFIIGMDSLYTLYKWREIERLLSLCEFVTVCRPGCPVPSPAELRLPETLARKILANVTRGEMLDISSTGIRKRIAQGESVEGLVPPAVLRYIRQHRLYLPHG